MFLATIDIDNGVPRESLSTIEQPVHPISLQYPQRLNAVPLRGCKNERDLIAAGHPTPSPILQPHTVYRSHYRFELCTAQLVHSLH